MPAQVSMRWRIAFITTLLTLAYSTTSRPAITSAPVLLGRSTVPPEVSSATARPRLRPGDRLGLNQRLQPRQRLEQGNSHSSCRHNRPDHLGHYAGYHQPRLRCLQRHPCSYHQGHQRRQPGVLPALFNCWWITPSRDRPSLSQAARRPSTSAPLASPPVATT